MNIADIYQAAYDIREALGLRRLDPRRLYLVDDGAYRWIGDRAELNAQSARVLRGITALGRRPDRASAQDHADAESGSYDQICGSVRNLASVCGGGLVSWDDLPESWRDGSALGPIRPL